MNINGLQIIYYINKNNSCTLSNWDVSAREWSLCRWWGGRQYFSDGKRRILQTKLNLTLNNCPFLVDTADGIAIMVCMHRVMYDRVRNKEIYVEMTAFFNFEEEISNVGNSYENKNWIFPLLIFLIQLAERQKFQNNISCSIPPPGISYWNINCSVGTIWYITSRTS